MRIKKEDTVKYPLYELVLCFLFFLQPKYFSIDVLVELLGISFIDERVMLSNIVTQLSLVNTFRLSSFWNASTNLPTILLILHSNVPSFVSNDTNVASLSSSLTHL